MTHPPATPTQREFEAEIHTDLGGDRKTYHGYLDLATLLSAQHPCSSPPHHDELLFIIQHQTSELWMKLLIHELQEVVTCIRRDKLSPSFKILARVGAIQRQLFEQWAVLETLTPADYVEFRSSLGTSSGVQSYQYRAVEFLLGNKSASALGPHRHDPEVHGWLEQILHAPSVYDEFLRYLLRRGAPIPERVIDRDFSQAYEYSEEVLEVFRTIYEDTERYWDEYEMCEKLVDVEQRFQLWRFRHMMTVQRVIGFKRGTGGSSGVGFLRKALDTTFYPELWDVRTVLKEQEQIVP